MEILSPYDVKATSLGGRGPLVFLNACQVGAAREVLGDYAGMAEAFLHAGASAVIAPLWTIDDGAAKTLALSLLQVRLRHGRATRRNPAGEEPREMRTPYERSPPSLVCLSYQFFGHPRYRLMHAVYREVL